MAALAAWGLDPLLRPLDEEQDRTLAAWIRGLSWAVAAAFGIIVPLAYVTLLLMQDRDPVIVNRVSISLMAVVSFAVLLAASLAWLVARRKEFARPATLGWLAVALIFIDVASLGAYMDTGQVDPSAAFEHDEIAGYLASQPGSYRIDSRTQIEDLWQPDTALLYGLEDVGGLSNPLLLADVDRYWQALGSRSTRLYDLLNVRYVLGKKDVVLDWDKFALVYDGDPDLNVYENRRSLPRAFIVPEFQIAATHEAALEAIGVEGFDPTVTAVIEGAAADLAAGGAIRAVTALASGPGHRAEPPVVSHECGCSRTGFREPGVVSRLAGVHRRPPCRRAAACGLPVPGRERASRRAPGGIAFCTGPVASWLAACRGRDARHHRWRRTDCDFSEETWRLMHPSTATQRTSAAF